MTNKFYFLSILFFLLFAYSVFSVGGLDVKVCDESGISVDTSSCAAAGISCTGTEWTTGTKPDSNRCWETWWFYKVSCTPPETMIATPTTSYYNWSTDESWGVDVCKLGVQCGDTVSYTCSGDDDCTYAYGANGYCGMVDWSGGGNVKGYYLITDTGTADPGTVTASSSWDINVKTQETTFKNFEIYKKSVMENYLTGKMFQPSAYLPGYQSTVYVKGAITYPDTYVGHKDVWEDVCQYYLCATTSDWERLTQVLIFANNEYTDNECSFTCGSYSAATIRSTIDNGFPVAVRMDGNSMELVNDGTSWGAGSMDKYYLIMTVYGYGISGETVTDYSVYHPYNQKQVFTAAEFNNWYIGFSCRLSCDIDSDFDADISNYAYDVVELDPVVYYETGGVFNPTTACWDLDDGGDDYDDPNDYCHYIADIDDCLGCPDVGGSYGGNAVFTTYLTSRYIQLNDSGTRDVALTILSVSTTASDRDIEFTEQSAIISWLEPAMAGILTYAAGDYDDDSNDDGKVVKTYTIGINISDSTSTGTNDFTKIWGACWVGYNSSGQVSDTVCMTNYTSASGTYAIEPAQWCSAACPGYALSEVEWNTIRNVSVDYADNFTLNVTLLTVMAGTSQANWNVTAGIAVQFTDASLIPVFDSVIVGGINTTDWFPPLTDPIIFNMNKTTFNEDYINWIAVDYDDDDDTDRCYGRNLIQALHCEHNATFLDGSFGSYWSDNQTTADNLELLPITITADGVVDANIKQNVSVQMATNLNISSWVQQDYKFQSATLIAAFGLVDSDSGTWDTDYGDTIWYNLNDTQFNRYNSSFMNIEEVNISAVDCYDNVLIKALCTVLGFLRFPDDWCYCVDESTARRNWNHSPILGVCYDYTSDATYDKCFSSHIEAEDYWTGFSMEDANKCDMQCDYDEHPEWENWYLNTSLGIGAGSETLEGFICNIYGNCKTVLQSYSFEAPAFLTNCSIVESEDVLVTQRTTSATTHMETASAISGTTVEININGSVANNVYFPNRYALWQYWGNNVTGNIVASGGQYSIQRRSITTDSYVFCNAADINDCVNPCGNWYSGVDICDDLTATSWDTKFNYTGYGTEAINLLVITGYDFVSQSNETYHSWAMCRISWSGPDFEGCILPSDNDDDLDDDFKVFINLTTANKTIGFDPNCSQIVARNERFATSSSSYNESILNNSFTGWSEVNKSNYNETFNTTGLTNEITGACWDDTNDGIWDAYAGYADCYDTTIEGGGTYKNITTACPNATINYSAYWWTHYNITRNDTNVTTIKVKVFDKCGATVVNSTKTAYWEKEGSATALCFNAVKDDENSELQTSGSTSISDYGGSCGLCTDGILNNDESKANYEGSSYDYGGYWCGYCDLNTRRDDIWLAAIKEYGLTPPFDQELCKKIEGAITIVAIFLVIIMLIILLALLFVLLLIGIPIIIALTKTTIAIIALIRRLRGVARKKKIYQRLARFSRKK